MIVEQNKETIRIRVKAPDLFGKESFATITLSEERGIKAVTGKPKSDPDGPTHVQVYLFDRDKWTVAEAEKWIEEHKKRSGMEKRSFAECNLRLSIENKVATLMGLAIPYNRLSVNPIPFLPDVKEKILPGAFKRSLESGSDVMMLWNHELKYVFGRTLRGTLKLNEDENGVSFENIPPDAQWVKDLIPSIKRGDI